MLLELGCQLVWATTWMADANEVISPRLGLPETLPHRIDPYVGFTEADFSLIRRWLAE